MTAGLDSLVAAFGMTGLPGPRSGRRKSSHIRDFPH